MFDWEFRASAIVSGVSNAALPVRTVAGGGVVPVNSVCLSPTLSLLTPGLGYRVGCRETGLFRIGVRPEVVFTPHISTSSAWNLGQDSINTAPSTDGRSIYWGAGISNWAVPEFLAEYVVNKFAVGAAFKMYNLEAQKGFINGGDLQSVSTYDLATLNTFSLYVKYSGFVLGFNLVSDDLDCGDGNCGLANIQHNFPYLLGYSSYF